jgi:hypothetical protein
MSQLVTSTSTQTSTALQLILLKFDDSDTSYVLQYRTAQGFDATTSIADSYSPVPFPAGVHVSLWLGEQLDSGDKGYTDDFMLYRDSGAL